MKIMIDLPDDLAKFLLEIKDELDWDVNRCIKASLAIPLGLRIISEISNPKLTKERKEFLYKVCEDLGRNEK